MAKAIAGAKVKISLMAAAAVAAIAAPVAVTAIPKEEPSAKPVAQQRAAQEPPGGAAHITLVTDSAPDLTDLQSYLRSITSQFSTPQEKAINIWRWSQRLRKQTTYPYEDGHLVLDPVLFFNSYGYCNCGIVSGLNNSLWLNMGWKARYCELGDHTVCETSWDGGKTWHMFDASMSIYVFNERGEVASVTEIEKNPRLYLENFAPECGTNPVKGLKDHQGWRVGTEHPVEYQRTIANGADSFLPPNEIQEFVSYSQWGRRYVLNLRPHEHYTRHFKNLDAGKSDPRYYRPVGSGKDVEDQCQHKNIRANGVWHYAPDLKNPATRPLVYSESGVTWTKEGVRPTQGSGFVTFKVDSANVVTSATAKIQAKGAAFSISRNSGVTWEKIASQGAEADLSAHAAGTTSYLLKVDVAGADARLESLEIDTITQINRGSMPRLVRGPNRIQVRLGRPVETITFAPSLIGGNHRATVASEKSLEVDPGPGPYKAILRAGANGEPCHATWKIEAPTPIVDLVYGGNVCCRSTEDRVTFLHSWDGAAWTRDYEKSDGSNPRDLMALARVEAKAVPPGTRQVYFRYEFQTPTNAGQKNYDAPGIESAIMTVHHQPRGATFAPIEATYCWVEHRETGDVERRHTELVTTPQREYTINVAGFRDPTMKWLRMNLRGQGPDGEKAKPGYSDGQDVGPGARPARARYLWGKNLALGKLYTLEGAQDERNPDAGGDLTDGIIAPPETYVSVKYMPTNVMFAKDVSPVATIDLGSAQTIAAVRVHAGQEGGFHLAYPETITVETSTDGKTFVRAGSVRWTQVFEPPADYVPWELDDASQFDDLPAGGRLAFAYRIVFEKPVPARFVRVTCACRKGWGTLLSEVQVFDKVTVDASVPPLVSLPPLPPRPSK